MATDRKVAVITGASQAIGAALITAYRDRDCRVVASARSIKSSDDTNVVGVSGDIADRETAKRVISAGVARFGRIDTLANCAGIFIAKPFTQYTETGYAAILGVNTTGFFHITQLAIAAMEKHGGGHVVQMSTIALSDGSAITEFDVLPASTSRLLYGCWEVGVPRSGRRCRVDWVCRELPRLCGRNSTPKNSPISRQKSAMLACGRLITPTVTSRCVGSDADRMRKAADLPQPGAPVSRAKPPSPVSCRTRQQNDFRRVLTCSASVGTLG
jgi:hypothetical protein